MNFDLINLIFNSVFAVAAFFIICATVKTESETE